MYTNGELLFKERLCLLQNRHRRSRIGDRSLLLLPDKITYRANLVSPGLSVPPCRPVRSVCTYPCTRRCNLTGMGGSKRARRVTSIPVSPIPRSRPARVSQFFTAQNSSLVSYKTWRVDRIKVKISNKIISNDKRNKLFI